MWEVFFEFLFEGKSGRRLNAVWYWSPPFWANKCEGDYFWASNVFIFMCCVRPSMVYWYGEKHRLWQRLASLVHVSEWTSTFILIATAKWHMLGSTTTCFVFDRYANIVNSPRAISSIQSVQSPRGDLVGLAPQKEIWNTINQWSLCQILGCQAPPTENFVATVPHPIITKEKTTTAWAKFENSICSKIYIFKKVSSILFITL